MDMLSYIDAIKRGMRDIYHCTVIGGTEESPSVIAPDGEYPLLLDGKTDYVKIENDRIHCCRFRRDAITDEIGT